MDFLPPPCAGGCGRPIRPYGTKAAEHPGTVVEAARGHCFRCYKRLPRVTEPAPTSCKNCECRLRPRNTTLEDFPDTRSHKGKGLCTLCHKRDARGSLGDGTPIDDPESTALRYSRTPAIVAKREALARRTEAPPELADPTLARLRAEREERKRKASLRDAWIAQEAARRAFIASRRAA